MIPFIFAIGPWSDNTVFFYNQTVNEDLSISDTNIFTPRMTDKNGDGIQEPYSIDGHYMTVTEMVYDELSGEKWLKVQTWESINILILMNGLKTN